MRARAPMWYFEVTSRMRPVAALRHVVEDDLALRWYVLPAGRSSTVIAVGRHAELLGDGAVELEHARHGDAEALQLAEAGVLGLAAEDDARRPASRYSATASRMRSGYEPVRHDDRVGVRERIFLDEKAAGGAEQRHRGDGHHQQRRSPRSRARAGARSAQLLQDAAERRQDRGRRIGRPGRAGAPRMPSAVQACAAVGRWAGSEWMPKSVPSVGPISTCKDAHAAPRRTRGRAPRWRRAGRPLDAAYSAR